MPRPKLVANSTDSQLAEAIDQFAGVEKAVRSYQQHQGQSTALLYSALADLYAFGEMLMAQPAEAGRSLVEEFIIKRGEPWNKVTRHNPYNALVQIAFGRSASSNSQYATVLRFASDSHVKTAEFSAWLKDNEGIKGCHKIALERGGSLQRQRNSQAKLARIEKAKIRLLSRPHSKSVLLPKGVVAEEGFALVLVHIDGKNNASIIDVVGADAASVDPVLLGYEQSKATEKSLLAAKPLGQLFRAFDLILGCTPDKVGGHERHILILNTTDRGRPVCRVSAVSQAYNYPWAGVVLAEAILGLPAEQPCILDAEDARHFCATFAAFEDWHIAVQNGLNLAASGLSAPISLPLAEGKQSYRVGITDGDRSKRLSVAQDEQLALLEFLDARERDNDRQNKDRTAKVPFPTGLDMNIEGGVFKLGLPRLRGVKGILGKSSPDRELTGLTLATADLRNLLSALSPYQTLIEGWFADTEIKDAAICFEVPLEDDLLSIVMPTKTGSDYNPCCVDLVLADQRTRTADFSISSFTSI